MDVLWMRVSRNPSDPGQTLGRFDTGRILVLLNREDYWQIAFVIPKGSADELRQRGLPAFRDELMRLAPFLGDSVAELTDWDNQIKLLTVTVDRLKQWSRPGLLCIGDSAHAMSPIGGVGINLAIQDAVATANILGEKLRRGTVDEEALQAVQRRRTFPTRATQRLQLFVQNNVIKSVLSSNKPLSPRGRQSSGRLAIAAANPGSPAGTWISARACQDAGGFGAAQWLDPLFHANDGQRLAVGQWNFEIFQSSVAASLIERDAGEGGAHFKTSKACSLGRILTGLQDHGSDSTPRPCGMNEEGANLGGVVLRVEQRRLAASPLIAAIEGFAFAPAAASDDGWVRFRDFFGNKISSIRNQLRVNPVNRRQRAFDLRGCVILRLQTTDRGVD